MCLCSIKITVLIDFGSSESVCARVLEGYASVTYIYIIYIYTGFIGIVAEPFSAL